KPLHAAVEEAAEKSGKKPPRRPHVVTELKPEVTAQEIFALLAEKGEKTIEIRWVGLGRATFSSDATIKPKREVIAPSCDEFMAYAREKKIDLDCARDQWEVWEAAGWVDGNETPISNWKGKQVNFARGFFGQFQRLGRNKPSQRAPQVGKDIKL